MLSMIGHAALIGMVGGWLGGWLGRTLGWYREGQSRRHRHPHTARPRRPRYPPVVQLRASITTLWLVCG